MNIMVLGVVSILCFTALIILMYVRPDLNMDFRVCASVLIPYIILLFAKLFVAIHIVHEVFKLGKDGDGERIEDIKQEISRIKKML